MRRPKKLDPEVVDLERRRARCPRTCAMEARFWEALSSWPRHHRLEVAQVGLGYAIDRGKELTDEEEAFYERVLREVEESLSTGVPA